MEYSILALEAKFWLICMPSKKLHHYKYTCTVPIFGCLGEGTLDCLILGELWRLPMWGIEPVLINWEGIIHSSCKKHYSNVGCIEISFICTSIDCHWIGNIVDCLWNLYSLVRRSDRDDPRHVCQLHYPNTVLIYVCSNCQIWGQTQTIHFITTYLHTHHSHEIFSCWS